MRPAHPLEVLVVAQIERAGSVVFSSVHLNRLQRVSVCGTKSDTKSDTAHETITNKRILFAHRNEASRVVFPLRRNTSLCYRPIRPADQIYNAKVGGASSPETTKESPPTKNSILPLSFISATSPGHFS